MGYREPKRMAILGASAVVVGLVLLFLFRINSINKSNSFYDASRNIARIASALEMYEHVSPGERMPRLSARPGYLIPDESLLKLVPEVKRFLLENPEAFISPSHPKRRRLIKKVLADPSQVVTDESYWYLGYALPTEGIGLGFIDLYRSSAREKEIVAGEDIEWGEDHFYPLREWAPNHFWTKEDVHAGRDWQWDAYEERISKGAVRVDFDDRRRKLLGWFLLGLIPRVDATSGTTGPSGIPLFIERPSLRRDSAFMSFLDGHVEWIPYPGPYPMTEKFIEALESLDELKID